MTQKPNYVDYVLHILDANLRFSLRIRIASPHATQNSNGVTYKLNDCVYVDMGHWTELQGKRFPNHSLK